MSIFKDALDILKIGAAGDSRGLYPGDKVRHFKRDSCSDAELMLDKNKYIYRIIAFAQNTDTDEIMVVYQAESFPNKTWVRPWDDFFGLVDREKYPYDWAKQTYRFERY